MKVHHWTGIKPNPKKYFGFIYLITNLTTGKRYIGRKQFHRYRKSKIVGESDWATYTGSNRKLNADILELGMENFTFKLILHTQNRGIHRYAEVKEIIKNDAILSKNKDKFYNGQVDAVRYRPNDKLEIKK